MFGCATCHVYVLCVYLVVYFFPVVLLLVSSRFVAIVRIRSSTLGSSSLLHLLHGHVLIPCGISDKMTTTLDLTTIIAMLVASFYRFAALPIICSSSHPNCHEPLTLTPFLCKLLFGYVTALLSPLIALLVAGEVEDFSMVDRILVGISQYLLYYLCIYILRKGWKTWPFA